MAGVDLLGNDGRECINACVKVSIFSKLRKYTRKEASKRLKECFVGVESHNIEDVLPVKDKNGIPKETFDIVDICEALFALVSKYSKEDQPFSKGLTQELLNTQRRVVYEYRNCVPLSQTSGAGDQVSFESLLSLLSLNVQIDDDEKGNSVNNAGDAARQLDDSTDQGEYSFTNNVNNYLEERKVVSEGSALEDSIPLSIEAQDDFVSDGTKFCENYPEKETGLELEELTETDRLTDGELDHGSGFIIGEHLVITCKHVIQDVLDDKTKEVRISNAFFNELPCVIVHWDPSKDLALLHCKYLNLEQGKISPLQLSESETVPGLTIFSFGYPLTCTGKTALLSTGHIAGSVERYGKEDLWVLLCPVIHGQSGSPVISKVTGTPMVVGVISQRHKKDILTAAEKQRIEEIRQSFPAGRIEDVNDPQTGINLLVLKLSDALETHCQFNYCNAVPGQLVKKFVCDYDKKCELYEMGILAKN